MSRATLVVRVLLGAAFLVSGALKLADPKAFARAVEGYGLVPDGWPLVIVALTIPTLELAAGAGALFDRTYGYGLTIGLLLLFLAVLAFGIANDLDVACGCFSLGAPRGQGSLRAAAARDAVMLGAAAWCLRQSRRRSASR